ncbi:hypothetical protein CerSpe_071550 [Prunus speciosa]
MTIILSTITCIIAIVGAWYNENYLVKEPSCDWDEERRCRLNRLYNGKEVDCIEQLRVSKKAFQSLCTILHENGGLAQTRNVSIEESVATFLNRITSVQVTDQWTTFRDTLVMQMFLDYQARGATNS